MEGDVLGDRRRGGHRGRFGGDRLVAARADAPRKFLEAILLELSRNQLVTSRRGKFGGYVLARAPAEVSFAIVERAAALADNSSPEAVVDEIAAKTDTSKRMIYYYFRDKEGLYVSALENAYRQVREGEAKLDVGGLPPLEERMDDARAVLDAAAAAFVSGWEEGTSQRTEASGGTLFGAEEASTGPAAGEEGR